MERPSIPWTGRRVVVLGGGGFIGSHLCARLLDDGAEVVAVDSWLTGRRSNVAHLTSSPSFKAVTGDAAERIPVDGPVDVVFHLASPASPPDYHRYPEQTLRAGSLATFRAIDLATRWGARLLFASTSEVYGDPLEHPQREDHLGNVDPIGPRAVYDEAKRFGEAAVASARRSGRADTTIARIFNTVGPGMRRDDGRVVPAFVADALAGRPMTIHGDGSQTRSIADVDDTVEGIVRLAASDHPGPINIGNPEEHTVLEVADWVADALQVSDRRLAFVTAPVGDPRRRCPDVTLAHSALGWRPVRSAREAVVRAASWLAGGRHAAPAVHEATA
jgi:dTDP-glucose 4,6-dehydratase